MNRFWSKVDKTSNCWEWQAAKDVDGYGRFQLNGKTGLAHRIAYELDVGEIPEGMCVLHKCDNPKCVRPDHLFVGTHADNVRDREEKGRGGHGTLNGTDHGRSILTDEDVIWIRSKPNMNQTEMAKKLGVHRTVICNIVNRKAWKHL